VFWQSSLNEERLASIGTDQELGVGMADIEAIQCLIVKIMLQKNYVVSIAVSNTACNRTDAHTNKTARSMVDSANLNQKVYSSCCISII
jgi:spore coat polysaccharide biosynthesis predicted glycosyltransferase SpsG